MAQLDTLFAEEHRIKVDELLEKLGDKHLNEIDELTSKHENELKELESAIFTVCFFFHQFKTNKLKSFLIYFS